MKTVNTNWGLPFLSKPEYEKLCPRSKMVLIAIYYEWITNNKRSFRFNESLNRRIGKLISEEDFTLDAVPTKQLRLFSKLGLVVFDGVYSFVFKDETDGLVESLKLNKLPDRGPKKSVNGPKKSEFGRKKTTNGPKKSISCPKKSENGPEKPAFASPERGVRCSEVPDHYGFERTCVRRKRRA